MAGPTTPGLFTSHAPNSSHFNSVSISATTKSPEISTNASRLKRATCNSCRERKVRCDREKPECGRCKRMAQACTYSSSNEETAQINSVLASLHSRLSKYSLMPRWNLFQKCPCPLQYRHLIDVILVQAETKLQQRPPSVAADSSESGFITGAGTPLHEFSLPNEIELGDVFPLDFESW